jgi:hypothetical protein
MKGFTLTELIVCGSFLVIGGGVFFLCLGLFIKIFRWVWGFSKEKKKWYLHVNV